ncbi:MAG: hypothetical protein GY760_21270 [Deltaproteobacteria bacterium]|nr:hypothetical protein [Deltaproteobacteria bacterium]
MAIWGPIQLTALGQNLAGKLSGGGTLTINKVKVGNGTWTDPDDCSLMTDLISTKIDNVPYTVEEAQSGVSVIRALVSNVDLAEGFQVREAGIFAQDPDVGEILYAACYAGDNGDELPKYTAPSPMEIVLRFNTAIGNAENAVPVYIDPELQIINRDYPANSILKADADNKPDALNVPEKTILGRMIGGLIEALTPEQVKTMLNILDQKTFTDNTILKADSAGNPSALTVAEDRLLGRKTGGVIDALTAAEGKEILGLASVLAHENFDANSILKADMANNPGSMTVAENTLVGRKIGGMIAALGVYDVRNMLNLVTGPLIKTGDYTVLASDCTKVITLSSDTSADSIHTFEALTVADDFKVFHFDSTEAGYKLTIKPPTGSNITVMGSGASFGIECHEGGTCSLRYDHSKLKLIVVASTGKWLVEELKLYIPGKEIKLGGNGVYLADEKTGKTIYNTSSVGTEGDGYKYIGSSSCYSYASSDDLVDIFNILCSSITDITFILRFKFDTAPTGNYQYIMDINFNESNAEWHIGRGVAGQMAMSGKISIFDLADRKLENHSIWYTFVIAKVQGIFGVYLDNNQIAYNTDTQTYPLSTTQLKLGESNHTNLPLDGNIKDITVIHQNIFNANPNSAMTDTINVPNKLDLILE